MKFNERDTEEAESIGFLIKSVLKDPEAKDYEVFNALKKATKFSEKCIAKALKMTMMYLV